MNRNKVKKIKMTTTAISLCSAMTLGAVLPAQAADTERMKDENVYVTLEEDGSVSDVYVVNEYTSKSSGTVTDYGDYSSVKNLTTDSEIKLNGNKATVEVEKGKFYYQGELKSTDIPWNIQIAYYLDGKKIKAEDLAGKDGHLVIKIKISENKNCDDTFFENYLLQATVVLNSEKCTNIVADGATAGNVGKDRQLLYNIMAGQEKEIEISADVEDFEMDGLTFKGVPMGFDIDKDSIDLSELTDKTDEIKDAVSSLDDGAGQLKDGTQSALDGGNQLSSGSVQLTTGIGTLVSGGTTLQSGSGSLLSGSLALNQGIENYTNGVAQLADGSAKLTSGLKELKTQVNTLANSAQLKKLMQVMKALEELKDKLTGLSNQASQVSQLMETNAQAASALVSEQQAVMENLSSQTASVNSQIASDNQKLQNSAANINSQISQAESAIDQAVASGAIDEGTAATLKENLEASRVQAENVGQTSAIQMPSETETMKQQATLLASSAKQMAQVAEGFSQAASQLEASASQLSVSEDTENMIAQLQSAVDSAYKGAAALESGIDQLNSSSAALKSGSSELVWGAGQLNTGIGSAVSGMNTLQSGAASLESGVKELNTGLSSLNEGAGELKDGTAKFKEQTSDIDEQIDDALDEMIDKISGSDYEPISFTSTKNEDIGLVQFAIRTDDIKKKEAEEVEKTEKKETLLDKIKGLF